MFDFLLGLIFPSYLYSPNPERSKGFQQCSEVLSFLFACFFSINYEPYLVRKACQALHILKHNRIQCFIIIFFFSELIKCDEDAFYFTHNPNNTVVIERQTALLSCKTSDASAVYYWTHNEQPIKNSTRKFQRGSNLYIRQANRDVDPGVYECIATLPSGFSIRSIPANLQVHCEYLILFLVSHTVFSKRVYFLRFS